MDPKKMAQKAAKVARDEGFEILKTAKEQIRGEPLPHEAQTSQEKEDKPYQEYHERRLVEMGNDTIISFLLCIDALKSDRKKKVAQLFIAKALPRCKATRDYILSGDRSTLEFHEDIIG